MCGRFVQYQGMSDYLEALAPDRIVVSGYDNQPIGRYNVAPGTRFSILLRSPSSGKGITAIRSGTPIAWHQVRNSFTARALGLRMLAVKNPRMRSYARSPVIIAGRLTDE